MTENELLLKAGARVSAKFRGTMCEAKVVAVDPELLCKVLKNMLRLRTKETNR